MNKVRQAIMPAIRKNRLALKNNSYYTELLTESLANLSEVGSTKKKVDHMENIIDIRLSLYIINLMLSGIVNIPNRFHFLFN